MTEAVQAQQIILATLSGALVVLFGAIYALLFALGRLRRHYPTLTLAYIGYACFAAATLVLAWTLNLTGFWTVIVIVMLVGYLLAPHGIWHLCVGTHVGEDEHPEGEMQ